MGLPDARSGPGWSCLLGALPATRGDSTVPLRRKESVDEIAAVVRLLVGPGGGCVTGQTVRVDGGAFLT